VNRIASATLCAALVLLSSCSDPTPPDNEIATELRALRAVLLQQQKSGASALPTAATPADRTQVTTALQPLREVLDGLVESQRELQTSQVTLTQEMQRWSQLLVETATGARQEEAKAMTQRLQQVEKTLQEQDKRHREVEALMQGALERTADRLEDFLRRLEGTVRPGTPPDEKGTPASKPPIKNGSELAPGSNGAPPAAGTQPPASGGGEEDKSGQDRVGGIRPPRHWSVFWWTLPLVIAASLGVAFLLRQKRRSNRSVVAPAATRLGTERAETRLARDLDGVQEIWAAAAMLSEAVDRLKQPSTSQEKPPPPPAPPPQPATTAADGVDQAEVSVLGEEREKRVVPPAPAAPETATRPAHEPTATRSAPARAGLGVNPKHNSAVRCRIPGASTQAQAELLRLLADDSRVLRRPEPVMATTPTAVEVAFEVLPGLPASERSQIEQRLRDAVS
jgi:hypothetical protein